MNMFDINNPAIGFSARSCRLVPNVGKVLVQNDYGSSAGRFVSDGGDITSDEDIFDFSFGEVSLLINRDKEENITFEKDGIKPTSSWTIWVRFRIDDASTDPVLFYQNDNCGNRVGLFVTSSGIEFFNGEFLLLAAGEFRDGAAHDAVISLDATGFFLRFMLDGVTTFSQVVNAGYCLFQAGELGIGGSSQLKATNRSINGAIYHFFLWDVATDEGDMYSLWSGEPIIKRMLPPSFSNLPTPSPVNGSALEDYLNKEWIDIYFIFGQSNASGRGLISDINTPPSLLSRLYPELTSLCDGFNGVYGYINPGLSKVVLGSNNTFGSDSSNSQFGPEVGLSYSLMKNGKKAVVSRCSVGGSSLYEDWNPNSGDEGVRYLNAVSTLEDTLQAIVGEGYIPRIAGFFWVQGERDAKGDLGGGPENYYADYLEALINNMRSCAAQKISEIVNSAYSEKSALHARFVIGRIKIGPTKTSLYPDQQQIVAAQDDVVEHVDNAVIVDTSSFPQLSDDLHFSADGQCRLGRAFFNAVYGL